MTSERCFECNEELTVTCLRCNTRAVPDVPELVRYDLECHGSHGEDAYIGKVVEGEYVLHSQAAEIIAAKDAEIERLRSLNHYAALEAQAIKRAEAAEAKNIELEAVWLNAEGKISDLEAKLAQYEAQEPVGCATVYIYKGRRNLVLNELGNNTAGNLPIGEHKLYTSPAPAVDLKAENERLRKSLEKIASLSHTTGLLWWQIEARKALNPSEPRT